MDPAGRKKSVNWKAAQLPVMWLFAPASPTMLASLQRLETKPQLNNREIHY